MNRGRLLDRQVGQQLCDEVVLAADQRSLQSDEHFTVDGTLIEAAESCKARNVDNPLDDGDRANATHQSTTGPEAKLVFLAHALMENGNGLLVDCLVSEARGTAERDTVQVLQDEARELRLHPKTVGADKGNDTRRCVGAVPARGVTPHVAQNTRGRSAAMTGALLSIAATTSVSGCRNGSRRPSAG